MNVIALILKSYSTMLFSIGAAALVFFTLGLLFILRSSREEEENSAMDNDMIAIAGDDVMATQLDLARAYLETGSEKLAKTILKTVAKRGGPLHRAEARRLLRQ